MVCITHDPDRAPGYFAVEDRGKGHVFQRTKLGEDIHLAEFHDLEWAQGVVARLRAGSAAAQAPSPIVVWADSAPPGVEPMALEEAVAAFGNGF